MDIITRNEIMLEHEYIIKAVIRRNQPLLKALRMEDDDVHQELSIVMLKALEVYDSARS